VDKCESKELSWEFVTTDKKLSETACELIYAHAVVSAASTDTKLYNGSSANGEKIVDLESAAITGLDFNPPKPVYCHAGLYIDIGTNVTGVFLMWRVLPRG
tara:strand:- start:10513 stop:10815 length:303 start_codon:yes stop_codon:yes gene_type:complete